MLKDFKGASNTAEVLKSLVGEKIASVFYEENRLHIVMESGDGFWVCSPGGEIPSYGAEKKEEIQKFVKSRTERINSYLDDLRFMPGVELP